MQEQTSDELLSHFVSQAPSLLRPAKGHLPYPYIVPGGAYQDELWDWDSFWVCKGLFALERYFEPGTRDLIRQHAIGSWKNFLENQAESGAIPIMAQPHKPDFFDCTTENGIERNNAKPIFAQFAKEISLVTGETKWLAPYFPRLLKFFKFWLRRYQSPCGLLVWGSDVAAGPDNDPTLYGRPEFSSGNIFLNCLFYKDLQAAMELADELDAVADRDWLAMTAESLREAIQSQCWDAVDGFYYSVDLQCGDHRDHYLPGLRKGMDMKWQSLPLKVKMFTGFLPMWCGAATEIQARLLVEKHLRNDDEFAAYWGVRSLARNERMYEPDADSMNPSNWLGPIWIVVQYMIYDGLKLYGYLSDADALATKTRELLKHDLRASGTLHECYHPDSGKPNFNAGFYSWNILATLMH